MTQQIHVNGFDVETYNKRAPHPDLLRTITYREAVMHVVGNTFRIDRLGQRAYSTRGSCVTDIYRGAVIAGTLITEATGYNMYSYAPEVSKAIEFIRNVKNVVAVFVCIEGDDSAVFRVILRDVVD